MSKTAWMDTIGLGFIFWALGFILGMVLFTFVDLSIMGIVISIVMIPLTIYIAWKRFNKRYQSLGYYLGVGLSWLVIPIVLDYIIIVKGYNGGADFYDWDLILYYILMFAIPVIIGLSTNRSIAQKKI